MGSSIGSIRTAAARIGVSVTEYEQHRAKGDKWCTGCKSWRLISEFTKDRSRGDGLNPKCRSHGARLKGGPGKPERQQRARQGQRWCRGCESWLDTEKVSSQGVCRPCSATEARQRYRGPAGAQIRAKVSSRRRGLEPIPPWWQEQHVAVFAGMCAYGCGTPAQSIDHIWPVSLGGRSVPGNLAPACTSCNSSKKNNHPAPWLDRGLNAFPAAWTDLAALALEHGTDEWLEDLSHV